MEVWNASLDDASLLARFDVSESFLRSMEYEL